MPQFLKFKPRYKERVWGGRALGNEFQRSLPESGPIGESWEMVDREGEQSVVDSGPWVGMTLREVIRQHGAEVMGPKWPVGKQFPLLVKWLDCRERLSLQLHPTEALALKRGWEPKTENWYFAHVEDGAGVFA